MTSIITFLLHSLFSPSKQPGGRDGGNIARYHFYFYSVAGLGAGDLV